MTYRERREAKADRLRGWADKREARSDAAMARVDAITDMIPFGQPILVGHHSEGRARADQRRIENGMRASIDNANKAAEMRSRAANIEAAAAGAIYSDDPDVVERLEEKLAGLLAERAAIVAYNKTARKGTPDVSLLPERHRRGLEAAARAGQVRDNLAMPSYVLSNLGGTINAARKRLEGLSR